MSHNCHCDDEPEDYHEETDICAGCGLEFDCWNRHGNDHKHCQVCRKKMREGKPLRLAPASFTNAEDPEGEAF